MLNKYNSDKVIKAWRDIIKDARHICMTTNSSYLLAEAIACGGGIGMLPKHYEDKGLVCLDNFEYDIMTEIFLFAKPQSKDIPRVRAVIDYYKSLMNKMQT